MNEDKGTRYHRARRRLTVLEVVLVGAALLLVVLSGVSSPARDALFGLGVALDLPDRWREPFVLLLFAIGLALLLELVALPWYFLRSFVLERSYGLTSESLDTWLRDHLKASGVALVVGLAAVEVLFWIARESPRWWWAWATLGTFVLSVLIVALAPVLLLPLFYRVRPLDRRSLRERLLALAVRAGRPALDVYEWKVGERTRKANAALAGLGRTRRILLSDTLLERYSEDEIEVVLAHELSHHVHADVWRGLAFDAALAAVMWGTVQVAVWGLGPLLGLRGTADVAALPFMLLVGGATSLVLQPLAYAQSRAAERRADHYALALTRRPEALISALRRLGQQNLAEEQASRLVEVAFLTHPPLGERIAAVRRWKG
ncbi:MAG: M48 family metalloprotease [Luteitalea sp.]|nr:M48 family metalloprotease [Luteitalea sp.]